MTKAASTTKFFHSTREGLVARAGQNGLGVPEFRTPTGEWVRDPDLDIAHDFTEMKSEADALAALEPKKAAAAPNAAAKVPPK